MRRGCGRLPASSGRTPPVASPCSRSARGRPGSARGTRRGTRGTYAASCGTWRVPRSEEHTSELQSRVDLVCRLLLEKKKKKKIQNIVRYKTEHIINTITIVNV